MRRGAAAFVNCDGVGKVRAFVGWLVARCDGEAEAGVVSGEWC